MKTRLSSKHREILMQQLPFAYHGGEMLENLPNRSNGRGNS